MTSAYYDTAYLFKYYAPESGSRQIDAHARELDQLVCSAHGRIEFASICHRKVREGAANPAQLATLLAQLASDTEAGLVRWLPAGDAILARAEAVYRTAPATVFLRAADALHLACAAEHGFSEIFSNDRHLLAAAPLFGLRGTDLLT